MDRLKPHQHIERLYLRHNRKNIVLVLDDLDYDWDERELREMEGLWRRGVSLDGISIHFDRDVDEVALAIMHLKRRGRIEERKGGVRGWVET